ncbi:hypothetical protein JTE90_006988 [Oedothorax gibbosus]|uniref:MICOS complex subunit MIC60 n=1 Tax=Oedothorax gibbosus TaxID=931172 RepID=A0AAV6VBX9_9ARAC|nr:hypothetical protein JTE90_006988 [Oedothorax gibbosus]
MWRSLRLPISKSKVSTIKKFERFSSSSASGGGSKFVVGLLAATGAGFAGAVVYGKYDPTFKKVLKENVPYIEHVYKWLDGEQQKSPAPKKTSVDEKILKKKLDQEKAAATAESPKPIEPKTSRKGIQANENIISDLVTKLQKSSEEANFAYEEAVKTVKVHTNTLYEALDMAEGKDGDIVWKDVSKAASDKKYALQIAEERASQSRVVMDKLKANLRKISSEDKSKHFVKTAEESMQRVAQQLEEAESKVKIVETEAKTASEYQNLVNSSKEQFRKELEIVLPNYISGDKDQTLTERDLNMLIAHAHRRIEQLQKQLAKQQVTEKCRVDEALRLQKLKDRNNTAAQVEAALETRHIDLENAIANRVATLKDNFEIELRKQLSRQSAAHVDHIEEVLKVQEQELERKFNLEVEEKLLHQKGVFISEVSGSMARLKGILAFLKAKSEFDSASKKAQALWLACQAMSYKISADNAGKPSPLAKDVTAVRAAADEDSDFINTVLAGIPVEAVERGVYKNEDLKERFNEVKRVCKRVALIDENNDSLYRYFLSYLQSLFIVDKLSIPKEELEGKVAVDPTKWDTYDVLGRICFSLKMDDLELALRYANQLKGEPREVAKDWMKEVRLLLETQLAVKALLAHAAAVGIQAYH